MLLAALVALVAVRALLVGAGEALAGRSARHLVAGLRADLTAHVAALGPVYVAGERSGEVASTMVDGLEAIDAWVRSFRPAQLLAVVVPVVVILVVAVVDPLSALVLLVTGPVLVALLGLIGARVGPATAARASDLRWMQGYFADMLRGLATLRAFGRSAEQADRIREIGLRYGDVDDGRAADRLPGEPRARVGRRGGDGARGRRAQPPADDGRDRLRGRRSRS